MSNLITTEEGLEKTLKECKEALVLFYASWCPYCTQFLPVFEKHSAGKAGEFCRVVTDDLDRCEEKYSIDIVPTVLFFKNGEVVKRLDGTAGKGLNEKQLVAMIDSCGLAKG
jgi:thioredoxin 1